MSDLFEVRDKVESGVEWRGSINVEIDGEMKELTIRQLVDTEFWEVMSKIDMEEIQSMQDDLPDEVVEEFRDLQQKDDLTEEEEERLSELQEDFESDEDEIEIFDKLSTETFEGIQETAKYCVEPDEDDVRVALSQNIDEIEDKYGSASNENARQYVNDHVIDPMIENSTKFVSFTIGVQSLFETLGETGN